MSVERLVTRAGYHSRYVLGAHDPRTGKREIERIPVPTWWAMRYADLVERRIVTDREHGHSDVTYTPAEKPTRAPSRSYPRPVMTERPAGMSRQVQRKLYRMACKIAGVPWRDPTPATPATKGG